MAYHNVTEAVVNVVRHARAQTCKVELKVRNAELEISVSDDGIGLTGAQYGVGLSSMREREELGGSFLVVSDPPNHPGVHIRASLPLFNVERRRTAASTTLREEA